MTSILVAMVALLSVPTAMLFSPWLLTRILLPRVGRDLFLAATGLTIFGLNLVLPCALHMARIPLQQSSLATAHFATLLVLALLNRAFRLNRTQINPDTRLLKPSPAFWWLLVLLALLVFPFTHMAGIDTYKWQDLATNMAVEQNIPWLIHPLALAGFSPRSYPSLHPILQGSLMILSHTGVAGAFWLTSLVIAFCGIAAANLMASSLTTDPRHQIGLAALYVLSPVFMRYVHWGTGRGAYLAILPLFVWGLLHIRRLSGFLMTILSGLALILAHKAGIPTLIILIPAMAIGLLLPTRFSWTTLTLLTVAFAVGVLLAPRWGLPGLPGHILGYILKDLRRFVWVGLWVLAGTLLYPQQWSANRQTRACFGGLLATLPLAHHNEMYGAMLALPFVTVAAWRSLITLINNHPHYASAILKAAMLLTLAGALGIVVQRSIQATPSRVYDAAMFIEQTNPRGPFRVISSGRHGSHIQGYVSGCPRFTLHKTGSKSFRLPPPPQNLDGSLGDRASAWISYLRAFLNPPGIEADWYGGAQTVYHVILDDERTPPRESVLIYDRNGVKIFDQTLP